ncbi:dihydroneopterin aldolase [Candidatus Vallotia lariciata]|uniref:dihydroneopterin aldolase n=1 Tax=Candidatus Vallotia laricis TaxID=2018052 RepID=UPI001D01A8DB|nr:dihydroneopterin aldolase [Candidatus Vallotia lariciata]UDG82706.1 dihydroneopterin aldolase [Candidatus Vallotia lariciata]
MLSALSHPRLINCRRLFLRNYEIYINIGVHDFERHAEQRVIVNIDLFIPLVKSTPLADELVEVVDYDFMRSTIAQRVLRGHVNLQETLCDEIANAMLSHQNVRAVRVSTEKPDVYPDCKSVGVEIIRIKEI